jgi:hypothetical protein
MMDEYLHDLKEILTQEYKLEKELENVQGKKRELVKKIDPFLKADMYSTDFVRLQRKRTLVIDKDKLPEKYKTTEEVITPEGRKEIESILSFGKEVEGVTSTLTLIAYKKKRGL